MSFTGLKHSEATKQKQSLANKRRVDKGTHYFQLHRGILHPRWRGGKVEITCTAKNCGKKRFISRYLIERSAKRFCSNSCKSKTLNQGSLHPNWGKICSEETKRKQRMAMVGKKLTKEHKESISFGLQNSAAFKLASQMMKGKHFSHKTEFKKGNMSGANNPRWKGGLTYRNAKRINLKGKHTEAQWEQLKLNYNFTCPSCNKNEPEIKLTKDHIIPVSKGGLNDINNIQPLCRSCNTKKYTKIKVFGFPLEPGAVKSFGVYSNEQWFELVKNSGGKLYKDIKPYGTL